MRNWLKTAVIGLGLLSAASWMYVRAEDVDPMVGKAAPPLAVTAIDGKAVSLADQKGKVVIVDFWATWCPPCIESLPHLQKLSDDKERTAKGLVVWPVNSAEEIPDVKTFLDGNHYSFTVPMATVSDIDHWDAGGIPKTVVIGRDGKVKTVTLGYGPTSDEKLNAAVDSALNEPAP